MRVLDSYDEDYGEDLARVKRWSTVAIDNPFSKSWIRPEKYEKTGAKVPDEKLAEKFGVTNSIEGVTKEIEKLISFGYTKIQLHSSSSNEELVLKQVATRVLPSISVLQ